MRRPLRAAEIAVAAELDGEVIVDPAAHPSVAEGYALDVEEFERGLRCIAAPVRDQSGSVVAALGLAGPASRLTGDRLRGLAAPVMEAASDVSRNLGYLPSADSIAAAGT